MQRISQADCGYAWVSMDCAARIFTYARGNLQGFRNPFRFHPTEKPVSLYKWILKNYAKPEWTIFDSHVGSGSIRIACHDMGFDFTGCELDPDYWQAQEDRYQDHIKRGLELFESDQYQQLIFEDQAQ